MDNKTRRRGGQETRRPDFPVVSLSPLLVVSFSLISFLSRYASRCWYAICWCVCWAIGKVWFRFRSRGRTNVPANGPVLLVSNHQSHLDPVLVGIACPRQLRFMARDTLFFWPLGWLIRSLGAVPIQREGSGIGGLRTTLQLLRDEEAVLVFPEGTRTVDGRLQPLLPGFCALARRGGATIVPVAVSGAFAAMPRGRTIPRPHRIQLAFAPPIAPPASSQLNDDELLALVTDRITDALLDEPL